MLYCTAMFLVNVSYPNAGISTSATIETKTLQRPTRLCINLWLWVVMYFRHGYYLEPRPSRIASHLFLNHHFNHRASRLKCCKHFCAVSNLVQLLTAQLGPESPVSSRRRNTSMDFDWSLQQVSGLLYFGFFTFCSPARAWKLPCMNPYGHTGLWSHSNICL